MVETRAYLRSLFETEPELQNVLARLNEILGRDLPLGNFVTLFLARLDPNTRCLSYCGAGHEGWVIRRSGEFDRLGSHGPPLGLLDDAEFGQPTRTTLETGDIALFYTDGVVETRSPGGGLLGKTRALEVVAACRELPARRIVEELHSATEAFARGEPRVDDVTIVVIKAL
jgi:serine phosphatase RsbU (regulator of sigma subunit)